MNEMFFIQKDDDVKIESKENVLMMRTNKVLSDRH